MTPRLVALGVLVLGIMTLSPVRVDAQPGALPTALMLLLAAWAPLALPVQRPWLRRLRVTWTVSIVLLYLGWWAYYDMVPWLAQHVDWTQFSVSQIERDGGTTDPRGGWMWERFGVALAMAGLLASFRVVWRVLDRELANRASDSARQLVVIASAWLSLAGCVGAIDAYTRPDIVVEAWGGDRCWAEDHWCSAEHEIACWPGKCVAGVCDNQPPPSPKPDFCEGERSRISNHVRPCDFCRDLTRPWLRRRAGRFAAALACLGLLAAVGAVRRSRRAARWIARVGEGAIEGWSLVYYAPEWGNLIDIPRMIGGVEPGNLVLSCLVVVKPSAEPERNGGYRDVAAKGVVVGRLDATPWLGGLTAARRGEDDVRCMLRAFAVGFALAIVPMGLAVFVTFFTQWRGR